MYQNSESAFKTEKKTWNSKNVSCTYTFMHLPKTAQNSNVSRQEELREQYKIYFTYMDVLNSSFKSFLTFPSNKIRS